MPGQHGGRREGAGRPKSASHQIRLRFEIYKAIKQRTNDVRGWIETACREKLEREQHLATNLQPEKHKALQIVAP